MNRPAPACGELFPSEGPEPLADGAVILRGFALGAEATLLEELRGVIRAAPFRRMWTPGGRWMSVAMTNCGSVGWISDATGYRYAGADPVTDQAWPALPGPFDRLATAAAAAAGFPDFHPDACLINRYRPGDRLTLHQDRNEQDFAAPIVSVSLGLDANFVFGGLRRQDRVRRARLRHGDVVVWGGPARLAFHGVLPLEAGEHAVLGAQRLNLTFRRAL